MEVIINIEYNLITMCLIGVWWRVVGVWRIMGVCVCVLECLRRVFGDHGRGLDGHGCVEVQVYMLECYGRVLGGHGRV